ncbi:NAD(P)-dependent oxidoreductase [Undibacterium sp.]|uniref:NAD(P)-dependent oxidoreductase n=1 Tax=Undibacterium sp. TaxID=1914977 RepID=UPI0027312DDD|nr:NAD(P)-dependent oxidoreductase [Undibacterium sp.]MDP1977487.1 NAD(P)-dependent oxidoreductase [Undibacterium sp.]
MKTVSETNIAFLGTGLMGKPMARRLLAAGFPVTVWNRTLAKAEVLMADGARVAGSALLAIQEGKPDVVITMLEDGNAVAEVIGQILPDLRAGSIVIDMSSIQQSQAQAMHALLQKQSVHFIDAPVSGGVIGAEAGSLAIMAGADEAVYPAVIALLSVMGKPQRVGDPGTGQLAKLCNQLIVGATINIVAEALLLAQAGGADPAAVRQALRGGFAESRILEVHGQRMLDRTFMPGGQVKSQAKDMENILIAAQHAGVDLPITRLVADVYRSLLPVHPHADHSAALLVLEQKNPGKRLTDRPDVLPA